jgi:23S rRNA (adenine2503-C2)-methyltransferase
MREFEDRLAARGIPVTMRDTRGSQIDGACGQLAAPALAPQPRTSQPEATQAPGTPSRAPQALQISARVP